MSELKTLVIDNFRGQTTYYLNGNINSGYSWVQTVSGQNPFVKPGQLTWSEQPTQIDAAGSVITDLIMDGKERVESGILYVYAIGHTGRLYKIQVNDPATFNPNYDTPVLLATLTLGTPTFTRGGFIDFFGATEQIYIGHDKGVTEINFDGTSEAVVGSAVSWVQTVPRPLKQFLGKLYAGNGDNLAEIIDGGTVASYGKLTPSFPDNTQVRDIDISPSGTYMEVVVSRLALFDLTSATQETITTANSESYIFRWNGIDIGYTSFSSFPSFSLNANIMFQNYQYTFGTDQFGTALFNPTEKVMAIPEGPPPLSNAIISSGNMILWAQPLYFEGVVEMDIVSMGSYVTEVGSTLSSWDLAFLNATSPETDVVRVPFMISASNIGFGSSSNGYVDNVYGNSKIYFSTLETSSAPTTKYRFYKWTINSASPLIAPSGTPLLGGIYQTQNQLFSKKAKISQVRIYGEPWIVGNAFTIDLIGSDGNPMTNGSKTFTAGSNLTVGDDMAQYVPQMAPFYAIGVSIIQEGTTNHTINKIEIDYSFGGD